MQGTVVVKPEGAAIPTPEAVLERAARIQARGWKTATKLLTAKLPANTVLNGPAAVDASRDVDLFLLRPARLAGGGRARPSRSATRRRPRGTTSASARRPYIRARLQAPRTGSRTSRADR